MNMTARVGLRGTTPLILMKIYMTMTVWTKVWQTLKVDGVQVQSGINSSLLCRNLKWRPINWWKNERYALKCLVLSNYITNAALWSLHVHIQAHYFADIVRWRFSQQTTKQSEKAIQIHGTTTTVWQDIETRRPGWLLGGGLVSSPGFHKRGPSFFSRLPRERAKFILPAFLEKIGEG